jgi:hypothetical protein
MSAGYSKRPLVEKLGIKPGARVAILSPPRGYRQTLGPLPPKVAATSSLAGPHDFIHIFVTEKRDLEAQFSTLKKALAKDGALWVSWPKGSSGFATDVSENVVRDVALSNGLVDVKVCAVDEVWSGLKLVFRLKDRS